METVKTVFLLLIIACEAFVLLYLIKRCLLDIIQYWDLYTFDSHKKESQLLDDLHEIHKIRRAMPYDPENMGPDGKQGQSGT